MKRNLIFEGELAELYGGSFSVSAKNFKEAIKCIEANKPGIRKYFIEAQEKGVNYRVLAGDKELSEDDLTESTSGDFKVIVIPAGSKSGGGKILAALAILALMIINPGFAFYGNTTLTTGSASVMGPAALTAKGMFAASIATNLALTGIQQIMAPDPATDADQPTSYLFNGAQQNIVEGDPVPLLYGELRVPGTPISFEIVNREFNRNNVVVDYEGNIRVTP